MKVEEIERLLTEFYEGNTTESQEEALRDYFRTTEVPEHLQKDKEIFLSLNQGADRDVEDVYKRQFFVSTIQLFHLTLNVSTSHVGRHNDDGVLEVYHTSLIVCQSSVIQYLQQDVEYIRMRLFYFVE